MRVVFAGTPEAAVPSLQALLGSAHEVTAVLTRPDAPAGRGRGMRPSPVREFAQAVSLEVLAPSTPRDASLHERLAVLAPEACAVVAYGGLIPPALLALPPRGWVNLHFSLLPAWRGAAPVQHALIAGDEVTGATTFLLEEGLDTGPVLGSLTETVRPDDTAGSLLQRLAAAGASLLVASLDGLETAAIEPRPQPADGVSLAPKLSVADARVTWSRPGYAVDRLVRGCTPAPGAWTTFRGERVKLLPVRVVAAEGGIQLTGGELLVQRDGVLVGTADGVVQLGEVQPQGKRAMSATDWARGVRPVPGERLQ